MKATIIGTGSYIPEYILTNQELSTMVETDDEWIVTRTGISERRIQKSGDVADMAVNAALKALDNAGINSEDIDLIIAATSTPDYLFPNCSSIIQKNTGAINAVCFDISAACSGFIMALSAAKAYIEAGMYKKVLIVCSEKMSGITDWKDRSTCILFGDGAGACVVESSEQEGVKSVDLHNEGMLGEVLTAKRNENIVMNGQEVFKFAVRKVPQCIDAALEKAALKLMLSTAQKNLLKKENTDAEDIKYFILHQANVRIIESVAKRLGIDMNRFPVNLSRYGNTSSASIPILLDELNRENKLQNEDLLVFAGFGAGLNWGSILVKWNCHKS